MKFKGFFPPGFCALLGALLMVVSRSARAQTLFNGGLGTLPEAQGWLYGTNGPATELATNTSVLLDTSATASTSAGWSQLSATDLNRTTGFTFLFNVLLNAETHVSANRAGFSIIVLGNDRHGIELGFWTNTIFAQTDTPLFTHGEDATFATTNAFVNYALTILATNYVLQANGAIILSGPVRDYTASGNLVYHLANFIFFGDDTSSASVSANVRGVTLVLPPKLTLSTAGIVSWTGVSNQTYSVQASTNLTAWTAAGSVTSQSGTFHFTNSPAQGKKFFRVVFP